MSQTESQLLESGQSPLKLRATDGKDPVSVSDVPTSLPSHLVQELSKLPKLNQEQCGHLRHFHNLASQLDGDWSLMGGASGQDHDEGSYRYQIAFMAYAAGAAHYHRLPALRSVFRGLLEKLIAKMLHKDVWTYWYLTSQSGKKLDPDLKELRKPWADPVCKENVMYSGHLLLMVSLYSMLFDDDRYEEADSISFNWSPMFWGMGDQRFSYNRTQLQDTILSQMESTGFMGVCCEPNLVFIICNQFPIIATRYNDVRKGTNILDGVLSNYKKAWESRGGFVSENGLFRRWYALKQDKVFVSQQLDHSAWVMAFMPWNYDLVKKVSSTAKIGFLEHLSDRTNIRPPEIANEIRRIASSGVDPESPTVVEEARKTAETQPRIEANSPLPTFGFLAQWLSEVEGPSELHPLLRHADQYLNPTWSKGGLYYRRHAPGWDHDGNYLYMEPYSGNAAIGYSRLNVHGGQKQMFEHPWTKEEVQRRPYVEGVGLGSGVDFLRGIWTEEKKAMVVTLRSWEGKDVSVQFSIRGLGKGRWATYVNGCLKEVTVEDDGDDVPVEVVVGSEDVDIVVVRG